ncbi:unnamed protein product [Cuscuta campestris]|uniref:Uncharacterized protein n=1 Tax=Cuscuta campestris TaxID=132261 RepID=A0A484NIV7_9ASTE|nr:unnamed protein product [Cuscuta campestris]
MEEDEDARREAAIASARTLLPDIRPNSAVTADQLSKFQELRRRRLQIKAKSKAKRHLKKGKVDGGGKCLGEDNKAKLCIEHASKNADGQTEYLEVPRSSSDDILHVKQDTTLPHKEPHKRQKLHWGLDVKERWERKSNM